MAGEIAVLLSVGRHPVSGRACMAPGDASALELALRCGKQPLAIHAGTSGNPALSDYLGMGLSRLLVLGPAGPGDDIVPALAGMLAARKPRLVLCGMQSESGESSGMLPYLLARRLDLPLIANVAAFDLAPGEVHVSQAVSGGRRRRLAADLPAILTVGRAGPKPRQSAFAQARRGVVEPVSTVFEPDSERLGWVRKEARARPRKLRAGSSAEKAQAGALVGLSPREAAERLHAFLTERGILKE